MHPMTRPKEQQPLTKQEAARYWQAGPDVPGEGVVWVFPGDKLRAELLVKDAKFLLTCPALNIFKQNIKANCLKSAMLLSLNMLRTDIWDMWQELHTPGAKPADFGSPVIKSDSQYGDKDEDKDEGKDERVLEYIPVSEFVFDL